MLYRLFSLCLLGIFLGTALPSDARTRSDERRAKRPSRAHKTQERSLSWQQSRKQTNLRQAFSQLKRAAQSSSKVQASEARFQLARLYSLNRDYSASVREFKQFLNRYPGHTKTLDAYYYCGLAYSQLSDKDNALLCFDHLIYSPQSTKLYRQKAHLAKGHMFFHMELYDEALRHYQKIEESSNPQFPASSWHYHMGQIYKKKGMWSKVQKHYNEVLSKYPLSNEGDLVKEELRGIDSFKFTVQLGAFSKKKNGDNFHKKLLKNGFPSYIVRERNAGKVTYKVRVGHYDLRSQAQNTLNMVHKQLGVKGRILP